MKKRQKIVLISNNGNKDDTDNSISTIGYDKWDPPNEKK